LQPAGRSPPAAGAGWHLVCKRSGQEEVMSKTMRAAVVRQFGQPLVIEERPIPTPGRGQVLVRIVATGVCHTDLHAADGDWPVKPTLPFVPGHEGAGFVAAVGADVAGLREGDRVGVPWLYTACGACEHCVGGWETLCAGQQNTGYSVDGGYADYVIADARFVGRLPDGLSFAQAAPILCAGVTTYKGLKETEARPGQWVAVSGVGGLGHLAVQYARAMGLEVVAIDVGEDKLTLARQLGAAIVVDARAPDAIAQVLDGTGGGVHGALVTAVSPPAFQQTLGMLRRGGTCALVGLPPGDFATPIFDVVLKRLTVRGSIVGTRLDLAEALAFAGAGKVAATVETQPFEQVNEVLGRLRHGRVRGRVVLQLV
jgi:propanol-preferring alcohol dehydrogenase